MTVDFKLLRGVALRTPSHSVFTFTDTDDIKLTVSDKEDIYATARINDICISFGFSEGAATLPKALKTSGKLLLSFSKIVDGEVLQTWNASPMLLKDARSDYTAIPEIVLMEEKIQKTNEAVAELRSKLLLISDALSEVKSMITDPEI